MKRYALRFGPYWLAVHLFLIVAISVQELLVLLSEGATIARPALKEFFQKGAEVASSILEQDPASPNRARQVLLAYLNIAGIETGYGYFAPNVPDSVKLVFELHYPDGRTEYELPAVGSSAAGLRLVSLLEKLTRPEYDPFREYIVKLMAYSVWQNHPDVSLIRAVFGSIKLPTPREFERGERGSYELLYAYDFSRKESDESKNP